jgi:hypothetical protein
MLPIVFRVVQKVCIINASTLESCSPGRCRYLELFALTLLVTELDITYCNMTQL